MTLHPRNREREREETSRKNMYDIKLLFFLEITE